MIQNEQTEKIYCLAFTFRQALRFAIGPGPIMVTTAQKTYRSRDDSFHLSSIFSAFSLPIILNH